MYNLSAIYMLVGCLILSTKAQRVEKIRVTSILSPPYLMLKNNGDNQGSSLSRFSGYIVEVLEKVEQIIGIDLEITLVKDGKYGARNTNGSYSGMIGEVMRREADVAAAALTVTQMRRQVVKFSPTIQNFGYVFVAQKPPKAFLRPSFHERISHLYKPLEDSVWLMSLVAYLVTSTVLFLISYANPYEWRRLSKDGEATVREGETFNCVNSFWFIVSSWALQGFGARTPRSIGGRIVVLFWWIFVIVFVATYIASLTNLLRVSPHTESLVFGPIRSMRDLSKQTEVEYGFLSHGATEYYFQTARLPYMNHIWNHVNSNRAYTVNSTVIGVERVRKSKGVYAFIMESAMAKYYTKNEPCDLYYSGDQTLTGNFAFAYGNGFRHADKIDMAILKIRESGYLQELEEKWFRGECENYFVDSKVTDDNKEAPAFYKIDLGSFSGALIVLLIGVVSGSLITGVEIFIFRKAELPQRRQGNSGDTDGEPNDVSQPVLSTSDRGVTKL